jgi:hypothetical protein
LFLVDHLLYLTIVVHNEVSGDVIAGEDIEVGKLETLKLQLQALRGSTPLRDCPTIQRRAECEISVLATVDGRV